MKTLIIVTLIFAILVGFFFYFFLYDKSLSFNELKLKPTADVDLYRDNKSPNIKKHSSNNQANNLQNAECDLDKELIPELTLQYIFNTPTLECVPKNAVVLIATGDYIPARSVNTQTIRQNDFTWPVKDTAYAINQGDIVLVSLETPIFDSCPRTDEGFIFCGEDNHIESLRLLGADVVNLANNHAGDYGQEGINETVQILDTNNMKHSGIGEISYISINGTKFAFLGYNDVGIEPYPVQAADPILMKTQIKEAANNADVVVVSMSWGEEYTYNISERQKDLAYHAIDSGADLIIGNHPHWVQPVEIYKGKLITYAHGNYVFDQMWSEETKEGVIGKYTFIEDKLAHVEFIPTYITDFGKSNIADDVRAQKILEYLKENSYSLSLERAK